MLTLTFCIPMLAGCLTTQPAHVAGWQRLEVGMAQNKVTRLLGPPTSVIKPAPVERLVGENHRKAIAAARAVAGIVGRAHERWIYGEQKLTLPAADAFVVYFDSSNRVVGYRKPKKGAFSTLPKYDAKPPHH